MNRFGDQPNVDSRRLVIALNAMLCAAATRRLPQENEPGCILLDVRMPGLNGPDLQARLADLGSTLPIIFLTGHPDVRAAVGAIKAGAEDFLTKPVGSEQLIAAIERALARHELERTAKQTLTAFRTRLGTLTPREHQVFELVVQGLTNKHIARRLGGAERTIKAHRQRVMEKMGVQSLAELVVVAERLGVRRVWPSEPLGTGDHASDRNASAQFRSRFAG